MIKHKTTSLVGLLPSMLRRLRAIQRKDRQHRRDKCSCNSEGKEGGDLEEPKASVIVSQTSPLWPLVLSLEKSSHYTHCGILHDCILKDEVSYPVTSRRWTSSYLHRILCIESYCSINSWRLEYHLIISSSTQVSSTCDKSVITSLSVHYFQCLVLCSTCRI